MKLFLALIALVISAPICAAGQTNSNRAIASPLAEQEVRRIEREFIEARRQARRGDSTALERILADNFIGISLRGRRMNKAQFVRLSRNPNLRFTSLRTDETNIRVMGERARSTGRATVTAQREANVRAFQFRYVIGFEKRGDSWQIVSLQLTPIAQP